MNKWLNKPAGRSTNCQAGWAGQSVESSWPANPARTLRTASCRVTPLQPLSPSIRLQASESAERRGSTAIKTAVVLAAARNKPISCAAEKWCRNKFATITSGGRSAGCSSHSKASATTVRARQPDPPNLAVAPLKLSCRSNSVTFTLVHCGINRRTTLNMNSPSPAPSSTIPCGDRARKDSRSARVIMPALPIHALTRRKSRRERMARGSSGGSASSNSDSR